ncbi:hypothetical protein HCN44_005953 [Aphidius gifuensis]|uniref:Uncharacterized protein n=1 Tax=Aphidius gifuensis TaxID=684658 RepID=A0A834XXG3_APHGI|nr:hypothetical protein HCN44_005953 [Aphidius gifuensis]
MRSRRSVFLKMHAQARAARIKKLLVQEVDVQGRPIKQINEKQDIKLIGPVTQLGKRKNISTQKTAVHKIQLDDQNKKKRQALDATLKSTKKKVTNTAVDSTLPLNNTPRNDIVPLVASSQIPESTNLQQKQYVCTNDTIDGKKVVEEVIHGTPKGKNISTRKAAVHKIQLDDQNKKKRQALDATLKSTKKKVTNTAVDSTLPLNNTPRNDIVPLVASSQIPESTNLQQKQYVCTNDTIDGNKVVDKVIHGTHEYSYVQREPYWLQIHKQKKEIQLLKNKVYQLTKMLERGENGTQMMQLPMHSSVPMSLSRHPTLQYSLPQGGQQAVLRRPYFPPMLPPFSQFQSSAYSVMPNNHDSRLMPYMEPSNIVYNFTDPLFYPFAGGF